MLLRTQQLLVAFDDFEQNLSPGGETFLDPAIDDMLTALADAAQTGALLLTCRYPLPGPDRFLAPIPIPPLSQAELRRLFLRLPKLRDLDIEDRRLLTRTIGGHPRLIEFTDALLRGGHASFRHVQTRLRDLARAEGLDLRPGRPLETALDQAMLLGSADILLTELLTLLTPAQEAILRQAAVCRAPMTLDDLAFTLTPDAGDSTETHGPPDLAALQHDVDRLRRPHPAHRRRRHRHAPVDRRPGHPQHPRRSGRPARTGPGHATTPVRTEARHLRRSPRHPPPPRRPAAATTTSPDIARAGHPDAARHPLHSLPASPRSAP